MHVLISAVGTRGDVQPALALAVALRELGHLVRMCVPPNFTRWATDLGFEARAIGIEMRAPRPSEPVRPIPDLISNQFEVVDEAAKGCDLIVAAGVHQYAVRSIAELCGVPCAVAAYAPTSLPMDEIDSWDRIRKAWNDRSLERVNSNRARLGLAPVVDVLNHILGSRPLLAADARLAPVEPDSQIVQTGAWLLPDGRGLSAELCDFLDGRDAPVYVGLGSMPAPEGTGRILVEAIRQTGRRIILSRGWAELDAEVASDCIRVGDIDQQALFPLVAAVVHHGGAGTTTAAARAGVPQVALPMFGDQFYWSKRIAELGIGTGLPFGELDGINLAASLDVVLSEVTASCARETAPLIATDGAMVAAHLLTANDSGK